jgi:DNA-directed RNA polymerase subunit E'/Rpb7
MAERRNRKQNDKIIYKPYIKSLLSMKVSLLITEIGKNIKQNLEKKIISKIEGKCITEGFIRPKTVSIVSYSSGLVLAEYIDFHVIFECMVCLPVEGMLLEATVKTTTKAGIHAEVIDEEGNIPITVFLARDYHYVDRHFNEVKENDKIIARVIGSRFELNDPYICVIAKLLSYESLDNNEYDG